MATASDVASPLTRSSSCGILPPTMSELRVVLLANSWIQRCYIGNLLVDQDVFDSRTEPQCSTAVSGSVRDKTITVINTPDLLQPDITEDKLAELMQDFANMSVPGLHVFLLVLQPKKFKEHQQLRLQSILEKFRKRPFDHAMVLITTDREEAAGVNYIENQYLEKMIKKCRYRHMCWKNFEEEEIRLKSFKLAELHTRLGQIFQENNGDHLNYEAGVQLDMLTHLHAKETIGIVEQVQKAGLTAFNLTKRQVSEGYFQPRILLFGKSEDKKESLSRFITTLNSEQSSSSEMEERGGQLIVVKTPDLFRMSVEEVRAEISRRVFECFPGPNVLLLLVRPSDFTENDRETLKFILMLFGPNAFKHAIVIITHDEQKTVCVNKLLNDCEYRYYEMFGENLNLLMNRVEAMVQNNNGSFVTDCLSEIPQKKGEKETLAAVIMSPTASFPASTPQCIKCQREVYERLASKVQMPTLIEKERKKLEEPKSISLAHYACAPAALLPVGQESVLGKVFRGHQK